MKLHRILLLSLLPVLLAGTACRSNPVAPVADAGVVGVGVTLHPPFYPGDYFGKTPDEVYFIRLSDESDGGDFGSLDLMNPEKVYVSGRRDNGRLYLTDVPPGRYAAVAARYERRRNPGIGGRPSSGSGMGIGLGLRFGTPPNYTVFFSENIVRSSVRTVRRGEISDLGSFEIDMVGEMQEADDVQRHYMNLIAPQKEGNFFISTHRFLGVSEKVTGTYS